MYKFMKTNNVKSYNRFLDSILMKQNCKPGN